MTKLKIEAIANLREFRVESKQLILLFITIFLSLSPLLYICNDKISSSISCHIFIFSSSNPSIIFKRDSFSLDIFELSRIAFATKTLFFNNKKYWKNYCKENFLLYSVQLRGYERCMLHSDYVY